MIIGLSVITAQFKPLLFLFLIVFIHEMGHAICAVFYKWRIKQIMLLPFGGVAEMDEHGNRPLKEEVIVILAGPVQHFFIQALLTIAWQFHVLSTEDYQLFSTYNWTLFFFNLIPIFPLDGGKILFVIISYLKPFSEAQRITLLVSISCLIVYITAFLIFAPNQLNVWIIATFLIYSLYTEFKQKDYTMIRFLLERYYGKKESVHQLKPIIVNEDESIFKVLLKFQRGCKHPILIEKEGVKITQLDENELLHAFFSEKRTNATVGELIYSY
ncbi:M50 family metallopeptidase [Bacillus sp. IB182487]|uniref:M50 family metallopeptidase n=2 Tax=Metabacillus arenae TaxID=2771434 RepID=A0A926NHL1_9BACI|nr:M50 family metallopeptidase [Metabacillus arenae]